MSKKYRLELELTAAQLMDNRWERIRGYAGPIEEISLQVAALRAQARADRETEDLRLPWRVAECVADDVWTTVGSDGQRTRSKRAASIQAAGHELLEAVKAARQFWASFCSDNHLSPEAWRRFRLDVLAPIERALNKVKTGVSE